MSERGTLRIVVEGDDAKRFHEGLTGFPTTGPRIGMPFRSSSVWLSAINMACAILRRKWSE